MTYVGAEAPHISQFWTAIYKNKECANRKTNVSFRRTIFGLIKAAKGIEYDTSPCP